MRLESSFSAYVLDPLMRYHSTNLALQDASDNTHKWSKSGSERAIFGYVPQQNAHPVYTEIKWT